MNGYILACLVVLRVYLVIGDSNYDYPDECWQGPEVSYYNHHGTGFLTWQWTMSEPLRNPLYPHLLQLGYYLPISKEKAHLFIQALLAILTDYILLRMVHVFAPNADWMDQLLVVSNWYYLSTMSKTLINAFECTTFLLAYYLAYNNRDLMSRIVVGIGYIARPTSLLMWGFLWVSQLFTNDNKLNFILKNILTVLSYILFSFLYGSFYHGKYTLTQLNFLKYNFIEKWSQLFGVQSPSFYLTNGLPFMLTASIFLLCWSIYLLIRDSVPKLNKCIVERNTKHIGVDIKVLLLVMVYLAVSSLSAHKEIRFIFCALPLLLLLTLPAFGRLGKWRGIVLGCIIVVNIGMLGSVSMSGKTESKEMLREIKNNHGQKSRVMYLCEPHSLPAYSILLDQGIEVILLDSSPMAKLQNRNQVQYLENRTQEIFINKTNGVLPQYVIIQNKYAFDKKFLRSSYNFLQESYEIVNHYRNSLYWQQLINKGDGFVLLRLKSE